MHQFEEIDALLAEYPEVMTPGEVAAALRVEAQTVVKWFGDDHLPGFQIGPKRSWRVFKAELRKYLQANRNGWGITSE